MFFSSNRISTFSTFFWILETLYFVLWIFTSRILCTFFLHNLCNSFRIGLLPHWLLTKKPQSCRLDYCLNMSGTKTTTRWRCYLGGWDCLDWKLFCPFLVLSGRKHIARGYYFRIINNKFKKTLENKNSGEKMFNFDSLEPSWKIYLALWSEKKPWNKREYLNSSCVCPPSPFFPFKFAYFAPLSFCRD